MSLVQIRNLVKDYGKGADAAHILKGLNLEIEDGSFTVLLGPSGCGKSTLLRTIAGLEKPTSGQVIIDGEDVTGLEPSDRNLAMVFQNYALYPHMTAFQNVEYGLKIAKVKKDERAKIVTEALEMVGLADQAKKLPSAMSGGQRQRVALARAIVKRPGVYLMDEPLSNLDAKLRGQMRETVSQLWHQLGSTFIYVTHDQVEAMSMGTKIVLLDNGTVAQEGTPQEIYRNPSSVYAAGFIGAPPANILHIGSGSVAIRPEDTLLEQTSEQSVPLPARLITQEQLGDSTISRFDTAVGEIQVKSPCLWSRETTHERIYLPVNKLMYFDENGARCADNPEMLRALQVAAA